MEEGNDAGSWGDVCWGIASEHFDGTGRDIQGVEFGQSEGDAEGADRRLDPERRVEIGPEPGQPIARRRKFEELRGGEGERDDQQRRKHEKADGEPGKGRQQQSGAFAPEQCMRC